MNAFKSCRAAWAFLAKEWAGPTGDYSQTGLCGSLRFLRWYSRIADGIRLQMLRQIARHAPPQGAMGYRWPLGDRKSRAAFCRAMVRRLTRKKKVAK